MRMYILIHVISDICIEEDIDRQHLFLWSIFWLKNSIKIFVWSKLSEMLTQLYWMTLNLCVVLNHKIIFKTESN